ncbi:ATP-dependent DNA helicase [Quillaja saponaria]|uniref:ATP-dependent DNA helicase n=1 Tax=Quillaja saponaria TaxID=32244 RepID=A0AAD7VF77_QUISA|nr:ATP-dependent DNA helicase [Quillaja saponaria]
MDGNIISSDQVIIKVVEMGFEYSDVMQAVKAVGQSIDDVLEYILSGSCTNSQGASSSSKCHAANGKTISKRVLSSSHPASKVRQSCILEHFQSTSRTKQSKHFFANNIPVTRVDDLLSSGEKQKEPLSDMYRNPETLSESILVDSSQELNIGSDWVQKVGNLLQKHFGFSCLKSFQKEALESWLAHKDCLVLAATGSGKSLCFQIPALLTGKVVVVISPLISLMHDQCLKLAKHGINACFLGSGQPDNTVEQKAMRGMYIIIYVCPETVLRLIKPLQKLAESRGIALFAIDEVHCVSKWGHDFRPDYRRLSVLRESFSTTNLKSLKFDIPLMALTATATIRVREDILKSLCMSKETNIVLTSFFRSNLRFSVKHSRTSPSSYEKDFHELIEIYARKGKRAELKKTCISQESDDESSSSDTSSIYEADRISPCELNNVEDGYFERDSSELSSRKRGGSPASKGKEMSVEYLENDVDVFQSADDWDVACGEFCGQSPQASKDVFCLSETTDPPNKLEGRLRLCKEPVEKGPTLIYVPTRKETLRITKYLCGFGVKAAAYNASLPRSHLRQVHKEFHENTLQVVVATIAFGMGIDKLNVRRIIHYGWPQSLEAYYQEAGRAGRDGKLADCILYANLTRTPSLLPSRRSEEQTKQAYMMLSDCFRYGMNTSCCRAKILVQYFGEDFSHEKCFLCDICVDGPPQTQNLKEKADSLLEVVAKDCGQSSFRECSYDDLYFDDGKKRLAEKPSLKMLVSKIREQSGKFMATDILWWRGLARIMESKGYIREGDDKSHVQIKFPELTELGLDFLKSMSEQTFNVYPEADMLLAEKSPKSFSTFSEWGRGWADPNIRRQRLEKFQSERKSWMPKGSKRLRKRKNTKRKPDQRTVRGRLAAKLSKQK